jgi:hypothetical protein
LREPGCTTGLFQFYANFWADCFHRCVLWTLFFINTRGKISTKL